MKTNLILQNLFNKKKLGYVEFSCHQIGSNVHKGFELEMFTIHYVLSCFNSKYINGYLSIILYNLCLFNYY